MLAVAGGKGGCGKTTTTVGLALAAARTGRSALAIDADLDVPDLHRLAGVERPVEREVEREAEYRWSPGPRSPGPDATSPRHRTPKPVPGAEGVFVVSAADGKDTARFSRFRGARDHVFVDCPAGGGPDAAGPMREADRTLVVSTPDPPALRDAAKTAAMSRAVGTPVAGTVITRTETVDEAVESLLGTPVLGAVPPAERPLDSDPARSTYDAVFERLTCQRR